MTEKAKIFLLKMTKIASTNFKSLAAKFPHIQKAHSNDRQIISFPPYCTLHSLQNHPWNGRHKAKPLACLLRLNSNQPISVEENCGE
jgi:hypothetical protein